MGSGTPACRVLLLEDDALFRRQLAEVLSEQDDFVVHSAFELGAEALQADLSGVGIAIVDLRLPDMEGADVIREFRGRWPEMEVMAHTVLSDRKTVFEAIVAGASSYVLKGVGEAGFLAALRELRAGGAPMTPHIARSVIGAFQKQGAVTERYSFTVREREVLALLEEGCSYKEVGSKLHISRHTVHAHIKRIYKKLHAHTKAEALAKARLRGILE